MLTLATAGRWPNGDGSCLISREYAGSSPARPTEKEGHNANQSGSAHSCGPLAQWQSGGLLTRDRPGFESLMAHDASLAQLDSAAVF